MTFDDVLRVIATTKNMSLPTYHTFFTNPHLLLEALQDTTKHRNGNQNLPIPTTIGYSIFVNDLTYDEICKAVNIFEQLNE
jgi:3-dehydroquinate synthase